MKTWLFAAVSGVTPLALLTHIALAKSPAQFTAQSRTVEEFIVRGNEPFWTVTVGKQGIVYQTPETKPRSFRYITPIAAQGRLLDTVRVYRLGLNNSLILKKTDACSDTMSDRKYPYSATLILGDTVKEGCAERKP